MVDYVETIHISSGTDGDCGDFGNTHKEEIGKK